MLRQARKGLILIGALGIIGGVLFLVNSTTPALPASTPAEGQTAAVESAVAKVEESQAVQLEMASSSFRPASGQEGSVIERIEDPYPFSPKSFTTIHAGTIPALANILCTSKRSGFLPTSASGIIIDERGIVLTNAHVAQYVLLAQSGKLDLSCIVRTGAPARPIGHVEVLYLPPAWIYEHAADITRSHPTGTGEHDYALLRVTPDGASGENAFPTIVTDARERIGFVGDEVLAASYPAEFIGNMDTLNNLYPVTSIAPIRRLLTFEAGTADIIALSGVVEAQSGSSGGAVVNAWGRLIGLITTTSEGATTAERTLHAITMSYVDRDLQVQTGFGLQAFLGESIDTRFSAEAPTLSQILIDQIAGGSR